MKFKPALDFRSLGLAELALRLPVRGDLPRLRHRIPR